MNSLIDPVTHLRRVETRGLALTEFMQPPLLSTPKHFHSGATVLFTLQGVAVDRMIGREFECKASSILVRPAGEIHTHRYGHNGIRGLVVEIDPKKLEPIGHASRVLDRVGSFNDSFLAELGTRLFVESRISDSASVAAVEGLVLEILGYLTRPHGEKSLNGLPPKWLARAVEFVHENYSQPLGLSKIADAAGVHPTHFAEVFRKHQGCSLGQYVRRLRINHASRDVMFSDASLAEISLSTGFYDQSHFTRFFKRQNGVAPAKMRELARVPKNKQKAFDCTRPANKTFRIFTNIAECLESVRSFKVRPQGDS